MSSVLKPTYLHATDTLLSERYLRPDDAAIIQACDAATAFLRLTLAQPRLNIRPVTDETLLEWTALPGNKNVFMWHQQLSFHPDSGNFGFAIYYDDLLCGMTQNTFVERPVNGQPTNDVMIELVEKNSGMNPLSGFVLCALCETSRTFASLSGADRLIIFSIDSMAVMAQFPQMGFERQSSPRAVNAILDLKRTDGIDWPRFLEYRRTTGNTQKCSPPNPSI